MRTVVSEKRLAAAPTTATFLVKDGSGTSVGCIEKLQEEHARKSVGYVTANFLTLLEASNHADIFLSFDGCSPRALLITPALYLIGVSQARLALGGLIPETENNRDIIIAS